MHPRYACEASYCRSTKTPPEPATPGVLAAALLAQPAVVWALAHPTVALLAVVLVAAVAWRRRAAKVGGRPQQASPTD